MGIARARDCIGRTDENGSGTIDDTSDVKVRNCRRSADLRLFCGHRNPMISVVLVQISKISAENR
jgi:hypothetical protein